MSHLAEGTIVSIRDGMLVDGDATEHLDGCPRCRTALDDAQRRAGVVARALASLDPGIDVEAGKAAVRARLDAERDASFAGGRAWRRHLARAAAVLLVAAGAAYALPRAPLPGWVLGPREAPDAGTDAQVAPRAPAAEGGIEVNVSDGRIRVVLRDVRPGSPLDVVWTDGATARIAAAAGSSFSYAAGRAEASVTDGPVRVELPRYAHTVAVEVDGRTYLRRTSGSLEVLEPTVERTGDRIRFTVR